jgi:hypothetical protein
LFIEVLELREDKISNTNTTIEIFLDAIEIVEPYV